jgi:TonB-linked SusC/RagA family outer membrane protein
MRTKFKWIFTLIVAFLVQFSFAQEKTITGVVSEGGMPLPGATVIVKGTPKGTSTDFDGKYTIKANVGEVIEVSYVGMDTQAITVGASNMINVTLKSNTELDEVVITALNISKEKKTIGYATSQVKSDAIEQRTESDLTRILAGKASGVTIQNASGISGGATNVLIRTPISITGTNQPLYIVDGIPIENSTSNTGNFLDGNAGTSRQFDLDPNQIENVEVLKGYAATNLYGTQGRNGVIMITTKAGSGKSRGSKKNEITVSQGLFINELASLPDYSQKFGNGFDGEFGNFYSNWGPGFFADGLGGYNNPGTNVDSNGTINHPYNRGNLATVFPQYQGQRLPWQPYNQVKDFFRQGVVANTSIGIQGGSSDGNYTYTASYGKLSDEGFIPGNKVSRDNFSVGGMAKLTNKFTINASINASRTDFRTPPIAYSSGSGVAGGGLSVLADVLYTPTNLPIMDLPFQNPVTGASVWYREDDAITNPRWTAANSYIHDITDRAISSFNFNYEINDNLKLAYRVGFDIFNTNKEEATNRGSTEARVNGYLRTQTERSETWDHNLMLIGNYKLSNKFNLDFTAGATSRRVRYDIQGVISEGQVTYGVLRHFNFGTQSPIHFTGSQNILGIYANAELGYNNWAFLTVSGRQDQVSNINDDTIFYPSTSLAFLPLEALKIKSDVVSFLKLRLGYGTSAGFPQPASYPTNSTFGQDPRFFANQNASEPFVAQFQNETLGNPLLRPELHSEREIGIEAKLFKNRVSLDFSAYERDHKDLILNQILPASTGFLNTVTNIGLVEGYGFEGDLSVNWFKSDSPKSLNWTSRFNYTKWRSYVRDIGEAEQIIYAGFSDLGNAAIEGLPLNTIIGTSIGRDANGNFLVAADGNYVIDQTAKPIGDATPDFNLNLENSFQIRNFKISALVTYQHGGDIFSNTIGALLGRGVTTDTDNRLNTYVLPGVLADGSPNNIQINNSLYYFNNIGFGPSETRIFDASHVRLQEVSIGYSLPKKFLDKSPFGSLSITFSGMNLWYLAYNTPKGINFDPNVAGTGVGNGRGFDFLNSASSRRYGFSIKATF